MQAPVLEVISRNTGKSQLLKEPALSPAFREHFGEGQLYFSVPTVQKRHFC